MNRRRYWICALLLAIAVMLLGAGALGEEIIAQLPAVTEEALPDALPDEETLRDGYVEQVLYPAGQVGLYSYSNRSKLTEAECVVYDALKLAVNEIANGQRTSSYIEVPLESIGVQTRWYFDELEGTFFDESGTVNGTLLRSAIQKKLLDQYDPVKIARSLMLDEPFGFYWLDVHKGYTYVAPWGAPMSIARESDGRYVATLKDNIYYRFPVDTLFLDESCAADDANAPYTADLNKTSAALSAAENAQAILEQAEGKTDMERMTLYMQQIRALSTYNSDAAAGSFSNSSPWQLIWVFDNDPETKVVCEGYSKAFRYLCDMTEFDDASLEVYNVTGYMNGGAHMWSIVRYAGGRYLVDVTNCYTTGGTTDSLFFSVPRSGDAENGYLMVRGSTEIRYVYNESTKSVYTEGELTLTMTALGDLAGWGSIGNLMWNLSKDGCLTVSGDGALDASAFEGRTDVTVVVLEEGVTSIGAGAFSGCDALRAIYLPTSVGEIGDSAFAGCDAIAEVLYAGTRKESRDIAIGTGNDALMNVQWDYMGDSPIDLSQYQVLYLPQGIESIEAEAFEGVTAEVVVLPVGVIRIGSRAFADCENLLYLIAPVGTELIVADNAFEGSDVIII